MTTPIYKSTIGVMIRQAEALTGILTAGREHLGDGADAFINEKLIEDMLPFSFQIRAVCHQSLGGIKSMRSGQAGPPPEMSISTYADLEKLLADTIAELKTITPEELDSLLDKDLVFVLGDFKLPFKGLGFLTSFLMPNFFFHMTTAYNLLRQKGVPIGKREYLGAMDMNMG
ncbi:MAG: DUF1993 domain-containing protein [Henriciella sp.]|nr:DUF1993 domain-containing protein [Hyphomonadaceae bacterium]